MTWVLMLFHVILCGAVLCRAVPFLSRQEQAEPGRSDEAKSAFVGVAQQQQQQQQQQQAPGLKASTLEVAAKKEEEDPNPWRGRRSVEFGATTATATPISATSAYMRPPGEGEMRPPGYGYAGVPRAGGGGGAGGRSGAAEAKASGAAGGSSSRVANDPNRVCILSLVKNETPCAPGESGRGVGGQRSKMGMGVASRGNSQEQHPMPSSKVPARAVPPERPRHGHQHQLQPKQEQGEEEGREEEGLRSRTSSLSPLIGNSISISRYYGPPHEGGEGMGVCEAHLDEDAAAGAFLAWEDVLAGSPDPPLDGGGLGVGETNLNPQDGLAQMGVLAGGGGGGGGAGLSPPAVAAAAAAASGPSVHLATASLGEVDRMRSHSDSAVAKGGTLDSAWRLAIGGSAFDLSSLPEEPVEGGFGGRLWQGMGLGEGGGAGGGGGGAGGAGPRGHNSLAEAAGPGPGAAPGVARRHSTAVPADRERGRESRSVSDGAASWGASGWGAAPFPQCGLPADSAAWDLALPRGFATASTFPFPTGSGAPEGAAAGAVGTGGHSGNRGLLPGAGNPNELAQAMPKGSPEATGEGGLPTSLSDVDISGLLLTPEELFCTPAGAVGMGASSAADPGNDMSSSNLQTLGMFNPMLLRNFQGSGGTFGGNNLAKFGGYPTPGTSGIGGLGLRSGDWIAATPHGLEGERGAAPAFNPVAASPSAPPAHSKSEGPGSGPGSGSGPEPGSGGLDEGEGRDRPSSSAQRLAAAYSESAGDLPDERADLWSMHGSGLLEPGGE